MFFASSAPGEQALPKQGEDGKFHVEGELVLADWQAELGTRQLFSIATTTTRQCKGPEKNRKIVRPQCLDGVATINIV